MSASPGEASPPPAPPAASPPRAPAPSGSGSGTLLRVLTHTQNASAAVFSVFLSVHLLAPIVAVGGTGAADGMMLIGREYYLALEPVAVYLPLGLHITSSITRRAMLYVRTKGKAVPSLHGILGYALLPLVIPHLLLHRIIPEDPSPPISALSPSEFGYEFAGYAAATRPWMVAGYLVLTGTALWHAFVGSMKVVAWARRVAGRPVKGTTAAPTGGETRKVGRTRKFGLRGIVATLVGVVAIGLFRLSRDASSLSAFTARRFDAVYAAAPWAAIGLR